MKLGNVLNNERVAALNVDNNAYVKNFNKTEKVSSQTEKVNIQTEKVVFPEPYENANRYYNRNEFNKPYTEEPVSNNKPQQHNQNQFPMFDIKSILPMLMSGKFNDMLMPLMSLFSGGKSGGGMDFAKIFEVFKPKQKPKKEEKKDEDVSSKFDDLIIIED